MTNILTIAIPAAAITTKFDQNINLAILGFILVVGAVFLISGFILSKNLRGILANHGTATGKVTGATVRKDNDNASVGSYYKIELVISYQSQDGGAHTISTDVKGQSNSPYAQSVVNSYLGKEYKVHYNLKQPSKATTSISREFLRAGIVIIIGLAAFGGGIYFIATQGSSL